MAYSVINGAVGKSPVIEKINQISFTQLESRAVKELEQIVLGDSRTKYPYVSCSFDKCRNEMRDRLIELREGNHYGKQ